MNFTLRGPSFSAFFEVIFAYPVTSGFFGRVAGTLLAPHDTVLLPSTVLRVAFSPIAVVSLFQGIQLIVSSLAGAGLCAWLLRSDPDAA